MGMKVFDKAYFIKNVERMVVQPLGSIDIYLKDGHVRTFETLKLRSNKHETTITDVFKGKIFCDGCGNAYRLYRQGLVHRRRRGSLAPCPAASPEGAAGEIKLLHLVLKNLNESEGR